MSVGSREVPTPADGLGSDDWRSAARAAVSHLDYESGAPLHVRTALRSLRATLLAPEAAQQQAEPVAVECVAISDLTRKVFATAGANRWHLSEPLVAEAIVQAVLQARATQSGQRADSFQSRVQPWMLACFGAEISADRTERNHRFFEEASELVQACGMTASEAHQLIDYTWARPVGEKRQETGGVMVTLAALCLANNLDMHLHGEQELCRISQPDTMEKIRAKQAAKPKHSPLPEHAPSAPHNAVPVGMDHPANPNNTAAHGVEPCPFCRDQINALNIPNDGMHQGPGLNYVTCDCGASGPGRKTVAGALAAWNDRAVVHPSTAVDERAVSRNSLVMAAFDNYANDPSSGNALRVVRSIVDAAPQLTVPMAAAPAFYVRQVHADHLPEFNTVDEFSDGKGGGDALYRRAQSGQPAGGPDDGAKVDATGAAKGADHAQQ